MKQPQGNLSNDLVSLGRDTGTSGKPVNIPLYQCSTMLFDTLAEFEAARDQRYQHSTAYYGRYGTPASFELETMMAQLEGGQGCVTLSSGLSAVTTAILATARAGAHILVADTVYGPTRGFCDKVLAGYGVEVSYFDPMIGEGVGDLIRPETAAVVFEAPGSGTFEVPDIPAIARAARAQGAVSILDGTWATPVFCRPLTLGVDIVVHSGSKYILGHSDGMIGFIVANAEHYDTVRRMALALGDRAGSMDIFLALRGLRTLEMRMQHHYRNGLEIARWLHQQPQVARVLHPALESCPGHSFWARDFSGAGGLFSVVMKTSDPTKVRAFVDGLKHFAIGLSWGGFESLALPVDPRGLRSATSWDEQGALIRFSIGNENLDTLMADLKQGLKALD